MTASGSGDHHKHGEDHPDPTLRRSLGDHDRTVHATGYPGFTDIGIMPVIHVCWRRSRLWQGAPVLAGVKAGPCG